MSCSKRLWSQDGQTVDRGRDHGCARRFWEAVRLRDVVPEEPTSCVGAHLDRAVDDLPRVLNQALGFCRPGAARRPMLQRREDTRDATQNPAIAGRPRASVTAAADDVTPQSSIPVLQSLSVECNLANGLSEQGGIVGRHRLIRQGWRDHENKVGPEHG